MEITPLSSAVTWATFDVIKLLFAKGGSIERGQLRHHAAYRRHPAQADILEYLVDKVIKVNDIMYRNRMDNYNMQKNWPLGTPFHRAAKTGNLPGVKWLVEHGADPRIRDSLGQLPLNRAEAWDRPDVVEYLRPITEAAPEPGSQWTDRPPKCHSNARASR